jgi:hypothetical protein
MHAWGVGRLAGLPGLVLLASALALAPAGADEEVAVELLGFLLELPGGHARVPPARPVAARLDVINELGGPRHRFVLELAPTTAGPAAPLREEQLVVVDGTLARGRVRALRVSPVELAELAGELLLAGEPLTLPLGRDRLVRLRVEGLPSVPLDLLLTTRTTGAPGPWRDGQPVRLRIVNGRRVVVAIEPGP